MTAPPPPQASRYKGMDVFDVTGRREPIYLAYNPDMLHVDNRTTIINKDNVSKNVDCIMVYPKSNGFDLILLCATETRQFYGNTRFLKSSLKVNEVVLL